MGNEYKKHISKLNADIDALYSNSEQLESKTREEIDSLLSRFNLIIKEKSKKEDLVQTLEIEKDANENKLVLLGSKIGALIREVNVYKKSLLEKGVGHPTLLNAIRDFEEIRDREYEKYLLYKKNPSKKGADVIKEQTKKRRDAEFELRKTKALIEYYELIAPFLLELKEDLEIPDESILENYSEEEREDYTTKYLTKEEYRNLPSIERNQMALDRFWKRPNKSNWLIGLLYERYVGYLYESKGYDVQYHGVEEGKKDLGRDLICKKGNTILVVQCKHWSQFKTIHEKHIFQLFGTTFQYKYQLEKENTGKEIKAIFHTSTGLSEVARMFAKELDIEVHENVKLDRNYPCIKCNISGLTREKIYHLPFDQQYDRVLIEPHKGEFYCATVKEAEEAGFRRALRHKFNKGA